MAAKTQTSTMSFKTLRGVFEEPKMHHRRDFLKENKLNLRELQKNTTQKLTHQKQEQQKKQYKHIEKFQKTREQSLASRSPSQCRNIEPTCGERGGGECRGGLVRQSRITAGSRETCDGIAKNMAIKTKSNCTPYRRAHSQQRQHIENIQTNPTCCCIHQQHQPRHHTQCEMQYPEQVLRSASSVSVLSKAESCDKEIQTEDINDEDFLYAALKKCSSSEVRKLSKQKSSILQQSETNYDFLEKPYQPELKCSYYNNQKSYSSHTPYESGNPAANDHLEQCTARSQNSQFTNGHIKNYNLECHTEEHEKCMTEDLQHQFEDLKMDNRFKTAENQQPLSARSRQTLCSTSTKRREKFGCREDLNLPRYLEKEKREKEEERLRELSKDPNCPLGHYALSEEERLKALHTAQQKMASLINELNHMPMTTETLRIRNRKAEIEKQLTQIEIDIRLYSKPKVYIAESLAPPQY